MQLLSLPGYQKLNLCGIKFEYSLEDKVLLYNKVVLTLAICERSSMTSLFYACGLEVYTIIYSFYVLYCGTCRITNVSAPRVFGFEAPKFTH